MKQFHVALAGLLCAAALFFTGCTTVPVTGRSQLALISPQQELQLGMDAFEQIKKEMPVNRDPKINALVQRVGERIAAVADLPDAQWEFVVFESDDPNAFALPGGKVGIFTGILPITLDEAGLATVIGHEVAHAAARHGAERASSGMALQAVGELIGAGLATSEYQAALMAAYGIGSHVGVMLPHSRKQETEADEIGVIYMARAGYDPRASIDFWQRFAEHDKRTGSPPRFLRTHPLDVDRISHLRRIMPRALQEYEVSTGAAGAPGPSGSDVISRPLR